MVIDRKEIVRMKLEGLLSGYSAYCETETVSRMLDKEIARIGFRVVVDRTPIGTWYIPIREDEGLNHENFSPFPYEDSMENYTH
ncbi:conserved hypothetical protein [[Clostridium] ultunense Esp]|uniref:hypothetical protein n=1 Tax=Thermicanus aegyptius TaxID=94009 RepID=UPI0002B70D6F|nr:hypothetical protein [Thermicanus aegyptius]CCQ97754.1 conserved hypothetical protein [[Clostridium] ultunense Esp]